MRKDEIGDLLAEYGLTEDNAIVIGSGIMAALGIRDSKDVDLVVSQDAMTRLKGDSRLAPGERDPSILDNDLLEIGASWKVLGGEWDLETLLPETVVLDGVRYLTLAFLLKVKQDWASRTEPRKKDVEDVRLIQAYLSR